MKKGNKGVVMKNYFTVRQVKISDADKDLPNQLGWDGAIKASPAWKAKMDNMRASHDSFDFDPSSLAHYHDCFLVQADDLDDVFRITNLWNDPDAVHTYTPGHSTSVGDIIQDNKSGDQFLVCDFGFKKVA